MHEDEPPEDVQRAFEALLDSFAAEGEHHLLSRKQQLRELIERMLESEDPRYDDWLRQALRALDANDD